MRLAHYPSEQSFCFKALWLLLLRYTPPCKCSLADNGCSPRRVAARCDRVNIDISTSYLTKLAYNALCLVRICGQPFLIKFLCVKRRGGEAPFLLCATNWLTSWWDVAAGGNGGQLRTCWLVSKFIDRPIPRVKHTKLASERRFRRWNVPDTRALDTHVTAETH